MSYVLVHGGGHSARCWDPLVPHLHAPVLALDLAGRGSRAGSLDIIRVEDQVLGALADLAAANVRDAVLVGHSMAGLTIPGILAGAADRFRKVVFVSCAIVPDGKSLMDTVPPEVAEIARALGPSAGGSRLTDEQVVEMQCYDMDAEQTAFTVSEVVPEAYWPIHQPIDLAGLSAPVPKAWVKLLRDRTFPPDLQDDMAQRAGCTEVVELESGHMAMISHPVELAAILEQLHG